MTDKYTFDLPKELIAQAPARPRDHARLLVYSLRDRALTDDYFYNLLKYLPSDTTLVLNNAKVENCRWLFGAIEVFVLEKTDAHTIRAMVRPGRKFKLSSVVQLTDWLNASVTAIDQEGIRTLRLNVGHDDKRLKNYEHIPLPFYLPQNDKLADEYQTVYAQAPGSLAAPTAGLHFTDELLAKVRTAHPVAELTLHVGLGTFAKLTDENIKSGRLHEERYEITKQAADVLNHAKHLTAVGTTSVRTLESACQKSAKSKSLSVKGETFNRYKNYNFKESGGATDIFIRSGHKFNAVDALITNFHLPSTSLLMLVAAFIANKKGLGEDHAAAELKRIYYHAITQRYRFYSFGDAMLVV